MIKQDQPTIFGDKLKIFLSSVDDGNMGFKHGPRAKVEQNVASFLAKCQINPEQVTKFNTEYDKTDFCQFGIATEADLGAGVVDKTPLELDGLATDNRNQALFYLVGDCCIVVLFDPIKKVLMMIHQGRHTAEQYGAKKAVLFLQDKFAVNPSDLLVWMSPAVGAETYPVFKRDNMSLHQIAQTDLISAGVKKSNIEICPVDTATNKNYFSHSQYLKGNRETNGRFGVVAQIA